MQITDVFLKLFIPLGSSKAVPQFSTRNNRAVKRMRGADCLQ